jgi:hypothetical protein
MLGVMLRYWRRVSMHPWLRPFTERRIHVQWLLAGRPIPAPPLVKQRIVKRYQAQYGLRTVIETGTFTGETVEAVRARSTRVISIELEPSLHAAAVRRFARAANVTLMQGDSTALLPAILDEVPTAALFWLDGHYAGSGTAGARHSPLLQEVRTLLGRPPRGSVILIDDARQLTGKDGYPALDDLLALIRRERPHAELAVTDDIIRWIDRPWPESRGLPELP